MFTFIHAADIHLDSPLRGLERYDGAPVEALRGATRRALENLVQLAIDQHVDFVLIAGDLYDGDWRDYNTGLFFVSQMVKLREAAIPVYVIAGNHDAQSQITRALSLPENVCMFSTRKPETIHIEALEVAIHGFGFPQRAVTDNLIDAYPSPQADAFNIGLLHTCATGREGHEPYAPCTVPELVAKGYDYWALGHVHTREILYQEPWIVFPGNIQGRHIREPGHKGCTLVTVDGGRVQSVEHHDLDVVRWYHSEIKTDREMTADDVMERVGRTLQEQLEENGDCLLAARITLTGNCQAHSHFMANPAQWTNQIRAVGMDYGGEQVWIEKVRFQTGDAQNLDQMLARDDAVGHLLHTVQNLASLEEVLGAIQIEWQDLQRKLPQELRTGSDGLAPDDRQGQAQLLADIKELLISKLLPGAQPL